MHKIIKICIVIFMFSHPLTDYSKVMEELFTVKNSDIEFSPDLHVLRSPGCELILEIGLYTCIY